MLIVKLSYFNLFILVKNLYINKVIFLLALIWLIISFFGCKKEEVLIEDRYFELVDSIESGINFTNDSPYTEDFNTYTYRNFYNGGGVALGDINNDGLVDIYFSGNQVDNKLYLNKGNWQFEDITEKAEVSCKNVWSTGVTFVDINGDGFLDLYVCKGGPPGGENRHNELFINNGDLTFTEKSMEYGLNITGLSIHAAFFDYDKDGDLDCYILNNSLRSVGGFDIAVGQREVPDPDGNKLMRNDGGKFVDVTQEAGIYSSNIGYGLGITLLDINLDGWSDIFISNDFFEKDYLYVNQQNGKFKEVSSDYFQSMSMGSMGADAADINNDLLPDIFVTEMLPYTLERKKTKAQYETWDKYQTSVKAGYHHQFTRNALHLNIGDSDFLEISRYAGVSASEWSWAALIQDFDNDGLKDIFVSNGLYKDLLDRDYLNYYANQSNLGQRMAAKEKVLTELVDSMPSTPIMNAFYKNIGNNRFENISASIGLEHLTFSNGSAYADLDNDGSLDLVVNNVNMPSYVYRNVKKSSNTNWVQIKLEGEGFNRNAIGSKIIAKCGLNSYMMENYSAKGFQSSVVDKIHLGLGNCTAIDSIIIEWSGGKKTVLTNVSVNQLIIAKENEATQVIQNATLKSNSTHINYDFIPYTHKEFDLNLFSRERLLLEMPGFTGPALAVADINGDSRMDYFIGGGRNQTATLYLSNSKTSEFTAIDEPFESLKSAESVRAQWVDVDNDGDLDLYVANSGKSFSSYDVNLNDALFINSGNGDLVRKNDFTVFPKQISTGDVDTLDFNGDGLVDFVIGEQFNNETYGLPGSCYILINKGNGRFDTQLLNSGKNIGMVTSIKTADINNDGLTDIVLGGHWMPITIIYNDGKQFVKAKTEVIKNSAGLWNRLLVHDFNNDGKKDILAGNIGLNNFYKVGDKMLVHDFDGNGMLEQIVLQQEGGKYYPVHDGDEIFSQLPFLKKKFLYYYRFANTSIDEIFEKEVLNSSYQLQLEELQTTLYMNEGTFSKHYLPHEIQYSTVNALSIDSSSNTMYFGGNNYMVKPQYGRQDASLGWQLTYSKNNNTITFNKPTSLGVKSVIRDFFKTNDGLFFVTNNNKAGLITHERK
jgi:enediyne biosynthesis protein E4